MKTMRFLSAGLLLLLAAAGIRGESFPAAGDAYTITVQGKERKYYPYGAHDYMLVGLKEIAEPARKDIRFFRRNPWVCTKVKVHMVFKDYVTVYGFSFKVYFADTLVEKVKSISRGDNLWLFGKLNFYKETAFDFVVHHFFDLPSDEEIFLEWKKKVDPRDADALIELGLKAIRKGVTEGNLEVWRKLGLTVIGEALKIKKRKLTRPAEYIRIAGKVLGLLHDKRAAAKIVLTGWAQHKENAEMARFLTRELGYARYKGEWMPEAERYEREFRDRFNAIKFNEDDKMWELKRWVEMNPDKFKDPQEKIILCARRTYEMNPARKDAAAFLGKKPSEITGFTSPGEIVTPRRPVKVKLAGGGMLEFTLDSVWTRDVDVEDPVKVRYKADVEGKISVSVVDIEWGENLEDIDRKFIARKKAAPGFTLLSNDPLKLKGRDCYWVRYTYTEAAQRMKEEAVLLKRKKDLPGVALLLRSPASLYGEYTDEFVSVVQSLVYTE